MSVSFYNPRNLTNLRLEYNETTRRDTGLLRRHKKMEEKPVLKILVLSMALGAFLVGGSPGRLPASGFDHAHSLYGKVLDTFVQDGWVDYTGLKQNPGNLIAYLDQLASVSEKKFREWSEAHQIAFLTNLYNAATLQLIIDHYPVKSIRKIGVPWKGPWKQEVVRLFGEKVTLDQIEHGLLRKEYKEPRVHFALVCAARSCPALRGEPYTAKRLDEQLDDQGRVFLNTPHKNYVDLEKRTVYLSKIFSWFSGDFEEEAGSVLAFVRPYFPAKKSERLKSGKFDIQYLEYDWSLNDKKAKES